LFKSFSEIDESNMNKNIRTFQRVLGYLRFHICIIHPYLALTDIWKKYCWFNL